MVVEDGFGCGKLGQILGLWCPGHGAKGDFGLQQRVLTFRALKSLKTPSVRGVPLFWGLGVNGIAEREAINHRLSSMSCS